jgi:hypothetical protein
MAKNFGDFETRSNPLTSDFVVGYYSSGGNSLESKTTLKSLLDLAGATLSLNAIDTGVRALTADFKAAETVVETTSAAWNSTRTTVQANSAQWAIDTSIDTEVRALTADFKAAETVVETTSAAWNSTRTLVNSNSSKWESTYTTVNNTSATLGVVASLVANSSASWEETATILPTVTNYLSTSNVLISSLEITDQIKAASSNVPVTIVAVGTNNKTFTNSDTNKVFHFDTSVGNLVATFPAGLADGFNVALMNIGTNSLEISAASPATLRSTGTTIIDQYGGAYVYEQSNIVYAVGRLF